MNGARDIRVLACDTDGQCHPTTITVALRDGRPTEIGSCGEYTLIDYPDPETIAGWGDLDDQDGVLVFRRDAEGSLPGEYLIPSKTWADIGGYLDAALEVDVP